MRVYCLHNLGIHKTACLIRTYSNFVLDYLSSPISWARHSFNSENIKLCIRMTSRNKPAFKNPFDLIEEQEEPMSMPTTNHSARYVPAPTAVHTPLPFNPYQISKEEKKVQSKKAQPEPFVPVIKNKEPASFSSPFAQPYSNQSENEEVGRSYYSQSQRSEQPPQVQLDQNGDPPLLYDIGVEPQKIKERIILVLKLSQPTYQVIHDPDLSGPIAIALTLGFLLLLAGKIHFGDIYAMFVFGNFLLYCLLNFMSQNQNIPFYNIMSILGYGLLPMLLLGLIGVFVSLNKGIGTIIAIIIASWASYAAGNFINVLMKQSKDRKMLFIYPVFLYYLSFTLIVIF